MFSSKFVFFFQKIKETKQFWVQLPYQFCNNLSLSFNITNTEECYNGTSGIYNGEYAKNVAGTSAIVNEQLYILTDLTDKLKKAYQGQEVEMVDDTGKKQMFVFLFSLLNFYAKMLCLNLCIGGCVG